MTFISNSERDLLNRSLPRRVRASAMKLKILATLAVCCVTLPGCAGQAIDASQSACRSLGLVPGTADYTQCVQQEVAMRDDAVNRGSVRSATGHGPQIPSSSRDGGAVLENSYVSGPDRVCLYDQSGHEVSVKVGAGAVCPQTLK
jgi:hypothetical protein